MNETSPGVGRVVMLVLFTVLFAAAWRSDRPGREPHAATLSHAGPAEPAVSLVAMSAVSLGESLPAGAATRLAPPEQTNGLTWHSDRGFGAALGRSLRVRAETAAAPTVAGVRTSVLGAQLAAGRCARIEAESTFAGWPALLSGTSAESAAPPPGSMNSIDDIATGAAVPHGSVAAGEEAATSVLR